MAPGGLPAAGVTPVCVPITPETLANSAPVPWVVGCLSLREGAALQVTTNRSPVYACAFNPQQPNLLATADAQGFVKVWRLSTHLSTMAANELQALEKLAATTARTADGEAGGDEEDGGYGGDDDFE